MIAQIEISNVRNLDDLTIKAGILTVLTGDNAEGKTAVIRAIGSVFEGGHCPALIRKGAKKAEITLALKNGTIIRKTITEKTSTLTITDPNGLPVAKPQAFVEKLASGFGFDPLSFIKAKPKERAAFLLQQMPIEFSSAEVETATGIKQEKSLDLDGLNALRKQIYERRTQMNAIAKDADGHMKSLMRTLGEDDGTDWAAVAALTEKKLREIATNENEAVDQIRRQAGEERRIAREQFDARERDLRAEYERKLAELYGERDAVIGGTREAENLEIEKARSEAAPHRDRLTSELATAKEKADQAKRNEFIREEISAARGKYRENAFEAERLTKAIERLDELKKAKLDSLPIQGVTFEGGEVIVDGLPFDELNTGAQFLKACEFGALAPGELGLMIADGAECLGPANWEAFKSAAVESGFQIITARVTSGPLQIETLPAA